jgi:hypothetical protein
MQADGLLVYSAGAVAPPLQTALNVFDRIEETEPRFVAGKPENLLNAIALNKKGDVMSCGAARAQYVLKLRLEGILLRPALGAILANM